MTKSKYNLSFSKVNMDHAMDVLQDFTNDLIEEGGDAMQEGMACLFRGLIKKFGKDKLIHELEGTVEIKKRGKPGFSKEAIELWAKHLGVPLERLESKD